MTSSGEVLNASSSENPDLFWAIRGGGSNFGIVTEFVLKLHPQRKTVFAGIVVYEGSKAEALTQVVKEWWEAGPDRRDTIFQGFTTGPDGSVSTASTSFVWTAYLLLEIFMQPCVILVMFWNGSEHEGRAHLKAFFDLGEGFHLPRYRSHTDTVDMKVRSLMVPVRYHTRNSTLFR